MASAFVSASLGIVPTVRHADYIGSWLVLREDNRASSYAPRARHRRPLISCSPFYRRRSTPYHIMK
jgi:antirestriction protein ArdC